MNRKETLVYTVQNDRCRLVVFKREVDGETYFVFTVGSRGTRSTTICFGLQYKDMTHCVMHGRFLYDLVTEILDCLLITDKQYNAQIEKIKNEVNIRYNQAVEKFVLDCGGRGIPVPFSNGNGENVRRRRRFFEVRKTRFDGISLPRDVDFLWSKIDRFPNPRLE
jgi:hypothetical protein